jgi:hypothetical protein
MIDGLTMVAGAAWTLLAFAAVAWMAGVGCGWMVKSTRNRLER